MPKHFTWDDLKKSAVWELNQHLLPQTVKGKSKYGNKRVEYNGIWFDSKREKNRYEELKVLELVGEITELQLQVSFQLTACKYIADFVYQRNGHQVVEDVKSAATKKLTPYRMKKRMMLELHNIEIIEI